MCTIMTFDREMYTTHTDAIIDRIKRDGVFNSDGWSLLLAGPKPTLIKTLSVDLVLDLLRTTPFDRFWLHARFSTTTASGIAHTHGFSAGDWLVFHNGVLTSTESTRYPVDSQLIATRVAQLGALQGLQSMTDELYVNAFVVNANTGVWYVGRNVTNTLYTDGHGNYSTVDIASAMCDIMVPAFTIARHHVSVDDYINFDNEDFIPYLREPDFVDLILDNEWERNRVPANIYQQFTDDQLDLLQCLRDELAELKHA